MNTEPRRQAANLSRRDVPTTPGAYAWYRDGEAVYAGRAIGADGLRERVWSTHLKRGRDLSRSSFRRNVCDLLGIAPTTTTRIRPSVMTPEEVEPVNVWIRECSVAWIECGSVTEARRLEKALLEEWMPPLSRR